MIESLKNTVIYGDCLDVMKSMPDKCVDLVLTDPPYGIAINKKCKSFGERTDLSREKTNKIWDDKIPTKEYFKEIMRISKNQIVFGANYFWENFYSSQCYIIWDKRDDLPKVPFCDTEFAWTSFNKMSKKYIVRNHGFVRDSKDEKILHPTQKPSELFRMIISDFTDFDMTIFDPFAGSGTTAIACLETGRNYILVEKEPEYVEIINKRISQWKEQGRLFPAHVI